MKVIESKANPKYTTYFFIVVGVIVIIFSVISVMKYNSIDRIGVYVVANTEKTSVNKSGTTVTANYLWKGIQYKAVFMPGYDFNFKIGGKYFIKILPNKPRQYATTNINVDSCFLKDPNWQCGWKSILKCP